MAVTVRIFAALREAAGTSQVGVPSATVAAIVTELSARFGEPFATRVKVASGLLDGQPVRLDGEAIAHDGAELSLLPPFSGGSTGDADDGALGPTGGAGDGPDERAVRGSAVPPVDGRLTAVLLAGSLLVPVLLGLGAVSERWAFGLVVMVVAVASLVDLHLAVADTGVRTMLPASLLLAIGPAALVLGVPSQADPWIGGVVAIGVVVAFLLTFASPRRGDAADIMGATLLVGLLVSFGAGALLLLYDAVATDVLVGMLALIGVTDTAVTFAARRTPPPHLGRLAVLAVMIAALVVLALWAVSGDADAPVRLAGFAVATVLATLVGARLRRTSWIGAQIRSGSSPARRHPALLIGTADGVLMAAPLALTWLLVIGR